jgi:hypothetical protein
VLCGLSNGTTGFGTPTTWTTAFSDAAGFLGDATGWGTIQYLDLNGDGHADICGRTTSGISCGLSNGTTGFTSVTTWLFEFTDANGWRTDLSYGATLTAANLNGAGCQAAVMRPTLLQPLVRRLAPF